MGRLWVGDLIEGGGASSSAIGPSKTVVELYLPFPAAALEPLSHNKLSSDD